MKCPKCRVEFDVVSKDRLHWRDESFEGWEKRNPGKRLRCTHCLAVVAEGKKPFVPQDQIRAVDGNGKLLFVHYRATASIKQELSARRGQLPVGFKGDGIALAERLGMSTEDLAASLEMSVQEMSTARFDIGKNAIEKAKPEGQ